MKVFSCYINIEVSQCHCEEPLVGGDEAILI
jgi:hypothetical protein